MEIVVIAEAAIILVVVAVIQIPPTYVPHHNRVVKPFLEMGIVIIQMYQ